MKSLTILLSFCCSVAVLADEANGHAQKAPVSVDDYRRHAAETAGDPKNGAALFKDQKLACAACHSLDGTGSKTGPDLATIGDKLSRAEMIDSILDPSSSIPEGYRVTMLRTRFGAEYSGKVVRSSKRWTEIRDGDGETTRVANAEIVDRRDLKTSLMPQGLHRHMSKQDLADMIAYLMSLKKKK